MKYGRAVTAAATRAGADMAPVFLGYKDLKRTLKLPPARTYTVPRWAPPSMAAPTTAATVTVAAAAAAAATARQHPLPAVNAKALAKIVKKHDKVTRSRAGAAYLDSRGGREELPWAMPALLAALEQAGRTAELLVLAGSRGRDLPRRGGCWWDSGHRLSLSVWGGSRPGPAATASAVTVGSTVAASVAPTTGPVDDVALSGTVCDATGSPSSISPDDGSVCGHIFCASCNASQLAAGDDRCALCRTPRAARTGVPAPELRAALTAAYPAAYARRRRALRREAAAAAARDNAYAARVAGLGGRGFRGGGWERWVGLSA
ncbi:hypothetical protein MMPV_009979 [Pyropia vietnamensis]